jgi:hypothetical protein
MAAAAIVQVSDSCCTIAPSAIATTAFTYVRLRAPSPSRALNLKPRPPSRCRRSRSSRAGSIADLVFQGGTAQRPSSEKVFLGAGFGDRFEVFRGGSGLFRGKGAPGRRTSRIAREAHE